MVETRNDGTRRAPRAAILQPMELGIVIRLGKGGEHEVIWVLEIGLGIGCGVWWGSRFMVWIVGRCGCVGMRRRRGGRCV